MPTKSKEEISSSASAKKSSNSTTRFPHLKSPRFFPPRQGTFHGTFRLESVLHLEMGAGSALLFC
eukprot:scaffold10372_cov243-Ochromonas_danica.AAC.2